MKNLKHLFMSLALLSFVACSNETENMTQGQSAVMLDFGTELTYGNQTKATDTRTVDVTPYKDVKNYTVELIKNGIVQNTYNYGTMNLKNDIEPGTYTFKAYFGENVSAAWDALYVEGSKEFTAEKGRVTKVQFVCTPANAKVKVVYTPEFSQYYSDCTINVTTKYQATPFAMTKADADQNKEAYFKVDATETAMTLAFDLKDKQGISVTPKSFGPQTVNVKARDFLTLTVKPNVVDVQVGKIEGITVTVDNGLTEKPLTVVITDSYVKE